MSRARIVFLTWHALTFAGALSVMRWLGIHEIPMWVRGIVLAIITTALGTTLYLAAVSRRD